MPHDGWHRHDHPHHHAHERPTRRLVLAAATFLPFGGASAQSADAEQGIATQANRLLALLDDRQRRQPVDAVGRLEGDQGGGDWPPGGEQGACRVGLRRSHLAQAEATTSRAAARAPAMPFTTFGVAPQRDGVVLGLSANTAIAEATSIYLRYEGDISGQDSAHALTAGVRVTW
jgi:hypothetical protein